MEITIADLFLFGWAVIATVGWHKYKEDEAKAKMIIHALINHKELRESVVAAHDEFVSRMEEQKSQTGGNKT